MKLPEKYRFTGGVMGNGMTLGLTNGTVNGGLGGDDRSGTFAGYQGLYGKPVGTAGVGGDTAVTKGAGITTDPEKSGITLEKEPWIVFIAY